MTVLLIAPDERALREHLRGARFEAGVAGGQWRLVDLEWPFGIFAVAAAERDDSPREFVLRLDLSGYPNSAPTGSLWDLGAKTWLAAELRPKGDRAAWLFRTDWNAGTAMYAPWDRVGLEGHSDWPVKHSQEAWNPTRDLSFLLAKVWEVLGADDYLGVAG